MIKEIDEFYWQSLFDSNENSVFINTEFLNTIATSFSYQLHYFIFEDREKVLMRAALFSYKGNIVTALPYTYSTICFNRNISERKYLLIWTDFLKYLKCNWKKISLRLPIEITDIRPFIWEGFKIQNRYTHIKQTDTGFHKSVVRNSRFVSKNGVTLKIEKPSHSDITACIGSLKRQIPNKRIINSNLQSLHKLAEEEVLLAFKAYKGEVCVCISLMLMDYSRGKAYALLISDSKLEFGHAFIYLNRTYWCQENNIKKIDFCGANQPGIANFKSFFYGKLQPYFIVSYNPFLSKLDKGISEIKKTIKKYL